MKSIINTRLPEKYCNLKFMKEITRWDEAVPLGNGSMGCLIWGPGTGLRFSLDRGDIWDRTPCKDVFENDFTYQTLIDLARAKNTEAIRKKFDSPYNHPVPTKLPAGKIIFDFGESQNIISELKLAPALAEIKILTEDSNSIIIQSYLHATEKAGFIKINKPLEDFSFRLENPEFSVKDDSGKEKNIAIDSLNTASLKLLKYEFPVVCNEASEKWFVQPVTDDFSYGVFMIAQEKDGFTEIIYSIAASNDGEDWQNSARCKISSLIQKGYDGHLTSHTQWWENYWNKSSISLPNKMFEKNWYLSNYLFGSCSRKGSYPMPLQGVWTADDGNLPPWKGDYHHDLNTQMSYYHYLKANHIEEGQSFLDFLWNAVPKAREFARTFFASNGLCLPGVMAIDGTPLGGWPMYTLNPINQLWLCQAFERHFRYCGDMKFLEEKAYPYMAESFECVLGLMTIDEKGLYVLSVSSSPEIHDDNAESWVTPNSNYDLSLMRYVAKQLIEFSILLNNGENEHWQKVLEKLPQLAVNDRNVLMLSPDESLMDSHRHHSHAMAIHPLRLLSIEDEREKEIIDATIQNLELLGTGLWVGFSFTWMAELYAVQGNGNGAAYQLEVFWRNCCSQNGFHLNGDYKRRGTSQFHYRPFTLEANMCAADALQEMLLQTEDNVISLFPAIPEEWIEETVKFEDFRGENGVLISATMENGKVISLTLKPKNSGKIWIKRSAAIESLLSNIPSHFAGKQDHAELELTAGEVYVFESSN